MSEKKSAVDALTEALPDDWQTEGDTDEAAYGYASDPMDTPEEELVSVEIRSYDGETWHASSYAWNEARGMGDLVEQKEAETVSEAAEEAAELAEEVKDFQ